MLEKFADWLAGRMFAGQAILKEDVTLVSFGIVQGLRTVIEIIFVLFIGIIMNVFWQSIIILAAFMPLRMYAGGYHAKTPMQCALKTWLLFFCFLLWLKYVPSHIWLQIILLLLVGICLWRFAPVEHVNKPLQAYEFKKYRKRAGMVYFLELFLCAGAYAAGWLQLSRSIVLGIVMVWAIMMAGVVEWLCQRRIA